MRVHVRGSIENAILAGSEGSVSPSGSTHLVAYKCMIDPKRYLPKRLCLLSLTNSRKQTNTNRHPQEYTHSETEIYEWIQTFLTITSLKQESNVCRYITSRMNDEDTDDTVANISILVIVGLTSAISDRIFRCPPAWQNSRISLSLCCLPLFYMQLPRVRKVHGTHHSTVLILLFRLIFFQVRNRIGQKLTVNFAGQTCILFLFKKIRRFQCSQVPYYWPEFGSRWCDQ